MTVYAWPAAFLPNRFEIRIVPNTRAFVGPYTPAIQVLDLLGERWQISLDMVPGNDSVLGAALEAFFDRLKGPANVIAMWNLRFPAPQGTLRDGLTASVVNGSLAAVTVVNGAAVTVPTIYGSPVLTADVQQLANTAPIQTVPGRTLRAGDPISLNGQLVRAMADATADGAGLLQLEFQPRARALMPAYSTVAWDKPTANFMLKADGVPLTWRPGMFDSASLDLIEVF